jgi:hypothetical protein
LTFPINLQPAPRRQGRPDFLPDVPISYQAATKRLFFVILSAAKNLSFKAAEILHSAALRSE